ncbi:N-acetyltransferase family protein [Natrialbaceae archaeon A-gly3]
MGGQEVIRLAHPLSTTTMTSNTCPVWNPAACDGTEGCPPRCPRFVDKCGDHLLVEPASTADLEGIAAMYDDYPGEHRSMGLPPVLTEQIRGWLETLFEIGVNFIARDGNRVVGHAAYAPADSDEPEFVVYVDPDYHGRGIGTELTRHAIAYAAETGHDALTLDVDAANERAIHVYHKMGFETVRRNGSNLEMRLSFEEPIAKRVRLPPAQRGAHA